MSRGAQDAAAARAGRSTGDDGGAAKPLFEVTGGDPTPEQVGILAAVFATAQGNAAHGGESDTAIRNDWGSFEDQLRPPFGYNPHSFLNTRVY